VSKRQVGSVKWFDKKKGYGFIEQKQEHDIFVYFKEIRRGHGRYLEDGQQVEFSLQQGDRGLQALDVVKL